MRDIELRDLHSGNIYHVCTDGTDCPVLMRDQEDFEVAITYMAIAAWRTRVRIAAYCIMSNHFHFLILCNDRATAQKFIRRFKQLYSTYLLKKYCSKTAMKGIADSITVIDSVNYLRTCIAYILRNAVCARICRNIDEYPWSSYSCYFRDSQSVFKATPVSALTTRQRREKLRIDCDLSDCPFLMSPTGQIHPNSFVDSDFVEKTFGRSGKSFLYYLGHCNDAQMEYELTVKSQIKAADTDLAAEVEKMVQLYYPGKSISQISTSNKCSIVKKLYFNNKTSIPQVSRVLGLPRSLVHKVLST